MDHVSSLDETLEVMLPDTLLFETAKEPFDHPFYS